MGAANTGQHKRKFLWFFPDFSERALLACPLHAATPALRVLCKAGPHSNVD